jgi:hypothetical protein
MVQASSFSKALVSCIEIIQGYTGKSAVASSPESSFDDEM